VTKPSNKANLPKAKPTIKGNVPKAKPANKGKPNICNLQASRPSAQPANKSKGPIARKPAAKAPTFKPTGGSRAKASAQRGNISRGGNGSRNMELFK